MGAFEVFLVDYVVYAFSSMRPNILRFRIRKLLVWLNREILFFDKFAIL